MWWRKRRIRQEDVELLLTGRVPEGREDLDALARAVGEVRTFAETPSPADAGGAIVAAAAAEARRRLGPAHRPGAATSGAPTPGRRWAARGLASGLAFKVVLGTAVALAGTAGAAAAGILPGPVQRFVERTADVVGLDFTERTTTIPPTTLSPELTTTEPPPQGPTTSVVDTTSTTQGTTTTVDDTTTTTVLAPNVAIDVSVVSPVVYEPGGLFEFAIGVQNLTEAPATLTALDTSTLGSLLGGEGAFTENTCRGDAPSIAAGETFSCTFSALLTGQSTTPIDVVLTALVETEEGITTEYETSVPVEFVNSPAAIDVGYAISTESVAETGAPVTFVAEIANTSREPATLESVVDSQVGDLLDAANPLVSANTCAALPTVLSPEQTVQCSFEAFVSGSKAEGRYVTSLQASLSDDESRMATRAAEVQVRLDDVLPAVEVTKTASTSLVATTSDFVTFYVELTNQTTEDLDILVMFDQAFGDVLNPANPNLAGNTCATRKSLPGGATLRCSYAVSAATSIGSPDHHHRVLVQVADDEDNREIFSDFTIVAYGPSGTAVSGSVFVDANGNGVRDEGEEGIGGLPVSVVVDGGTWSISTVTAADGTWSTPVLPGSVLVTIDTSGVPADYSITAGSSTAELSIDSGESVAVGPLGFAPPVLVVDPPAEGAPAEPAP